MSVLVISNINIGFQKSLILPLNCKMDGCEWWCTKGISEGFFFPFLGGGGGLVDFDGL